VFTSQNPIIIITSSLRSNSNLVLDMFAAEKHNEMDLILKDLQPIFVQSIQLLGISE
jgi:hypothetical protein